MIHSPYPGVTSRYVKRIIEICGCVKDEKCAIIHSALYQFRILPQSKTGGKGERIPHTIYACATMWHEDFGEMVGMLKSIFLCDEDQSARRITEKRFHVEDPDFYEFESKYCSYYLTFNFLKKLRGSINHILFSFFFPFFTFVCSLRYCQ